jgi:hypothetical protein
MVLVSMAPSLSTGAIFGVATPILLAALLSYYQSSLVNIPSIQCALLSASLRGKVSYPNSDVYASSTNSYWSVFESSIQPNCIVTPETADDVSKTVKLIKYFNYASVCKFAIRGGGHTPWAGSANIEEGVTIDMRRIKSVSLSGDETVAKVGAGAIWEDVHREMDRNGLSIIGGRASSVGVGGLTTGGMSALKHDSASLNKLTFVYRRYLLLLSP